MLYGKLALIHKAASEKPVLEFYGENWDSYRKQIRKIMKIPHTATFHHRDLFDKHGYFNDRFKILGDYEFLLREFKNGNSEASFMSDIIVSAMRDEGVRFSIENRELLIQETCKSRKLNNNNGISFPLLFWLIRIQSVCIY